MSEMTLSDILERIENGEDEHTEFKRYEGFPRRVAEAVCAFANSDGGLVVLGVDDSGEILGVDVDPEYLRDTLQALGTPRYAFGFLSSAITEHARNLPDDLAQDAEEWRIPRSQLDIVRAAWFERASLLRRNLN